MPPNHTDPTAAAAGRQPSSQTVPVAAPHRGDVWTEECGSEAAAKLRAIIAHAPVFVFAIGPDGRFTLSDGRGPAAFGLSSEQLVGQSAIALYRDVVTIDKDGRSMSGADAVRRALGGTEFSGLCTVEDAVLDVRLVPQLDEATGEHVGVVGVATDVSGHARAEATLREARDRLVVADRLDQQAFGVIGVRRHDAFETRHRGEDVVRALRVLGSGASAGADHRADD